MGEEDLPNHIKFWLSECSNQDCFFLVGPPEEGQTERIGAHKIFLIGHSEPLRAMLKESELAEKDYIPLIDVQPETFQTFLKCIYGASDIVIPDLPFEQSANLLYVAEKYLVHDIKGKVIAHMSQLMSPDNIFIALSHPVCFQQETLEKEILKTLQIGIAEILSNQQFLTLSENALLWLVQQEQLNVRELQLWNAVLKWAKYKTKSSNGQVLRFKIMSLLKFIRFSAMDFKEFCYEVIPNDILASGEVYEICKAFSTGGATNFEHLCNTKFARHDNTVELERTSSYILTCGKVTIFYAVSVCSLSKLKFGDVLESKIFKIFDYSWNILAMKRKIDQKTNFGYFLKCRSLKSNWSCCANGELVVINHSGKTNISRTFTHKFCENEDDWGYSVFYEWDELLKADNGFVDNNEVVLMTHFKVKQS